jgi:hypothetical protein
MMEKRDPKIAKAFDYIVANGFRKLAEGNIVELSIWEKFFSLLVPVILTTRHEHIDRDLVITFSVYCRSIRDYLREELGNDLAFIILNPSIISVGERKVAHLKNTAIARGQTLSQLLRSFHPDSNAPELDEPTIVSILTQQAQAGAIGFEPAQEDEIHTLAITDMTIDEIHESVRQFLLTL